jgi:hypothetical protein
MQFLKLWFLSKIIESSVHTILLSKFWSYLQIALRGEFYTHNTSVTMGFFKCLCQARKVSGHVYVRYNYGYLFSPVSTIFGFNSEIVPFLFFNVFSRLPLNYIVCTRTNKIRKDHTVLILLLLSHNNVTVCVHALDPSNVLSNNLFNTNWYSYAWFDVSTKDALVVSNISNVTKCNTKQ